MYLKEKTLSKLYFTALQGNKLWNNIVADYFLKDFVFFSLILEGEGMSIWTRYNTKERIFMRWTSILQMVFSKKSVIYENW